MRRWAGGWCGRRRPFTACEAVQHSGRGLFAGVPQGAVFTRYHSLILDGLPPEGQVAGVRVTATSQAGEIMALEVRGAAAWGVQFHPESLLSEYGRTLLGNWLDLAGQHRESRHETAAR